MRVCQLALVTAMVLAATLFPSTEACFSWKKAKTSKPLPDHTFAVTPGATASGQGSLGFCFCQVSGGMLGGLYKYGGSYVCAYTDYNSYGFSSCGVGSYYVLEQTFPTSDDPKLVNTTSATPLPKDAVPPPAEAGYKGYHACAGRVRSMAPDGQLLAGNLGPTPNGGLGCLVSKGYNLGGISQILNPGQYQALTGSKCAFPTDDDF